MSLIFLSNCAFSIKTILSCFYATFKQWLQEVKSPYTYFSLIKLISNFYDMYIIIHNKILQMFFLFIIIYNPKFKKLSNGYDCF